LRQRSS
jgi:hypothetical protein